MRQKKPREHDGSHLEFLRGLPCLVCLDNTATEAAHIRYSDRRAAKVNAGVGQKPSDFWCVPLCGRHHREQHEMGDEEKFWGQEMIDPLFVALALYVNSGDQDAGETIIRAAH